MAKRNNKSKYDMGNQFGYDDSELDVMAMGDDSNVSMDQSERNRARYDRRKGGKSKAEKSKRMREDRMYGW